MNTLKMLSNTERNCLCLNCGGRNSYLFANGVRMCQLKAKDSESFNYLVFLENTSVEISVGDLKETALYEYVYNFSVTS